MFARDWYIWHRLDSTCVRAIPELPLGREYGAKCDEEPVSVADKCFLLMLLVANQNGEWSYVIIFTF